MFAIWQPDRAEWDEEPTEREVSAWLVVLTVACGACLLAALWVAEQVGRMVR